MPRTRARIALTSNIDSAERWAFNRTGSTNSNPIHEIDSSLKPRLAFAQFLLPEAEGDHARSPDTRKAICSPVRTGGRNGRSLPGVDTGAAFSRNRET